MSASPVTSAAGESAPSCDSGPPPHQVIKLGIDVHLDRYVVVPKLMAVRPTATTVQPAPVSGVG